MHNGVTSGQSSAMVKVHVLIPSITGEGVHLIKGRHMWRLPRVMLSGLNYSTVWKHPCYITDDKATSRIRFVQTILDPTSDMLKNEFFIRATPPVGEVLGMKVVPWDVVMARKLSIQTRLLLLLWLGATLMQQPNGSDSMFSQHNLAERLISASLEPGV